MKYILPILIASTLIACTKRDDLNSQLHSAEVRINDGNTLTTSCYLICNGDTTKASETQEDIAIPYIVNIASIPFIDSIDDDYEFFCISGSNTYSSYGAMLYIPSSEVYSSSYFIKKGDQQLELLITQIY